MDSAHAISKTGMMKSRKSKLANSIGRGPRGRQALVLLHRLQRCEKLAQGPKSRVVAGGFGARGPCDVRTHDGAIRFPGAN